jgi:poly(A) polymerase
MSGRDQFVSLGKNVRQYFRWLTSPQLTKVISALEAAQPDCARFVGGCVRDSLLGDAPKDFDVATTLTPDVASKALKSAGLRVAPTGIEHGTITAIVDHQGVEVTTLRADVSTDGRRATVAFTQDWAIDAGRRDFTINAIYLTPDGRLFDSVGGVDDARKRRVRFIGEPEDRIKEDYLRILRFFRFTARFCDLFDEEGLAACAALKGGIAKLSAERIGAEMTGILSLPRAAFALEAMAESGVLAEIWETKPQLQVAKRMKELDASASAPLMLAALYGEEGDGVARRLRLSNAEKAERSQALKAVNQIAAGLDARSVKTMIYRMGKDVVSDSILLAAARMRIDKVEFKRLRVAVDEMPAPVLSVSGKHIVDAGVEPGRRVSKILADIEAQWIEEDFPGEARQQEILRDKVTD